MEKNKKRNNPRGRRTSLMEATRMVLNNPEAHTDMGFFNIPTCPLEYRPGTESSNKSPSAEDGTYLELEIIILLEDFS